MDQTYAAAAVRVPAAPAAAEPRTPIARAARTLAVAVAVGIGVQGLFYGHAGGLNAPIAVAALLLAAWLARPSGARIDRLDLPLPLAAVGFAAAASLRAEPMLIAGDVLFAIGLLLASLPALAGVPVVRSSSRLIAELSVPVVSIVGFGAAWLLADARPWSAPARRLQCAAGPAAPVLRGLLIATPFLVLFAVVFSAADAVFARVVRDAFDWRIDLGDLPGRTLLAACAAWLAGGVFAVAAGTATPRREPFAEADPGPDRGEGAGDTAAQPGTRAGAVSVLPRLAPVEVAVALLAIDALFLLFVVLREPALVPEGGRSGLDAEYLATLGDDAVPVLVAALPRLDEKTAAPIERLLARRRVALARDPALAAWPAWNLAREEARRALGLR